MCEYCSKQINEHLSMKSNCTQSTTDFAMIARGSDKMEIVISLFRFGTVGVEINYCPMCGRKLEV